MDNLQGVIKISLWSHYQPIIIYTIPIKKGALRPIKSYEKEQHEDE